MKAVDRLGRVQAEIAALREEEVALKAEVLASGDTEGTLFKAAIIVQNRTTVAWKAVAEYLKPSRQLVKAHSTEQQVTSIKVTARSTAALRAA
jgi:type II secretory pathway pseudopilin PulG